MTQNETQTDETDSNDQPDYPTCPYCYATLHDGDLDTEMCGGCDALFWVTEDGVIFEGGVEAL